MAAKTRSAAKTGSPPWALDAMTSAGYLEVGPYRVGEVTAAKLALLERIGSPLYTGEKAGASEWFPTLYVLTRPARESAAQLAKGAEAFYAAALDWADTVPGHLGPALILAARESARRLNAAADAGGDGSDAPDGGPKAPAGTAG